MGTWKNDNDLAAGGFTLKFEQTGVNVTGTGRVSGKTCVRDVTVEGTGRGSAVKLVLYGERDLAVHGAVEGDFMSGTWSSIACGTTDYGPTGTWQAKRAKQK